MVWYNAGALFCSSSLLHRNLYLLLVEVMQIIFAPMAFLLRHNSSKFFLLDSQNPSSSLFNIICILNYREGSQKDTYLKKGTFTNRRKEAATL